MSLLVEIVLLAAVMQTAGPHTKVLHSWRLKLIHCEMSPVSKCLISGPVLILRIHPVHCNFG